MKRALLFLPLVPCLWAAPPKVIFTKSFPGSSPAYVSLSIERTGALEYKEAEKDDQPLKAALPEADTAELFALAAKLGYFKLPLESGLKVASTGKKTFRYENESGNATEAVFNYSLSEDAKTLLNRFEGIASTERAYLELDRTAHFDKLGVNEALSQVESLWLRKELAAPLQFVPLLTRIAGHSTYMHLARERAARLKDQITGVVSDASLKDKTAQPQ
jgi:hypothetical protein